jgi:uncharacterized small protein (DUF1192 family)
MITKAQAIASLREGAQWVLRGDDLEWLDQNQTQPTDAEIAAEIARLEADYAAKQYQRDRAAAYPSLAEQMDMQYWDSVNGTTVWADTIAAIKQEHPKP